MDNRSMLMTFLEKHGMLRPRDADRLGISRQLVYSMFREGKLMRLSRGIYMLPTGTDYSSINLAQIAKQTPRAVISLISALSFHGLTTQIPRQIWITLPRGSWTPKPAYPPLRVTYASGKPYSYGVETHYINNVPVKIYNPAKTVADCFKFSNKVGLDVAIESLRDVLRARMATVDEIMAAAAVDRIRARIRPYLEALL